MLKILVTIALIIITSEQVLIKINLIEGNINRQTLVSVLRSKTIKTLQKLNAFVESVKPFDDTNEANEAIE